MKIASALMAVALLTSSAALAEPGPARSAPSSRPVAAARSATPAHPFRKPPSPEERLARLTARLELTPDQVPQVKALLEQEEAQKKALMESFMTKMKAVMTPEQRARMEQLRSERENARKEAAREDHDRAPAHPRPDFGFTPQQQIQMESLHLQQIHLMKADQETFLARMSAILTPLQERAFEQELDHHDPHGPRDHDGGPARPGWSPHREGPDKGSVHR
jgi:hypothetical protein